MLKKTVLIISILSSVQVFGYGEFDFSNSFTSSSATITTSSMPVAPPVAKPPQEPTVLQAEIPPAHEQESVAVVENTEVVTAPPSETTVTPPAESPQAMTRSLRPRARPDNLNTRTAPPADATATPAPAGNTRLYDMNNCSYRRSGYEADRNCYGSLSTTERATRVMNAAHYINRLHGTQFDARYMLCTGWRESGFSPGAQGASGERGMFQVMRDTARGALRLDAQLQEFKDMNTDTYLDRMRNSTLAQVELSFLVLQMKISDFSELRTPGQRMMRGTGTVEDYRRLAGRYNGGGYNSTYASKISACYSCMRSEISATATTVGSNVQKCLNRAK